MKLTEEFIEKKIRWKIKKNEGINKKAILFENWDKDTQIRFDSLIRFEEIGRPILLFLGKDQAWVIFGSKYLIAGNDCKINRLNYRNLEKHQYGMTKKESRIGLKSKLNRLFNTMPRPSYLQIKEKEQPSFIVDGLHESEMDNLASILLMFERLI